MEKKYKGVRINRRAAKYEVVTAYKKALKVFYEKQDLESLFLLRLITETGMRVGDTYHLQPSCLWGRFIYTKSIKTGRYEPYFLISKETEKIAFELMATNGCFFTSRYDVLLRRVRNELWEENVTVTDIIWYTRTLLRDKRLEMRIREDNMVQLYLKGVTVGELDEDLNLKPEESTKNI